MKFKAMVIMTILSITVFFALNFISFQLPNPISQETVQGKRIWQTHNCISCHTILGNGGYIGNDLTNITAKRTPEELLNFFVNPPIMRPNRYKLHPGLTSEEAEKIISYFKFTHEIPTLGWPPETISGKQP